MAVVVGQLNNKQAGNAAPSIAALTSTIVALHGVRCRDYDLQPPDPDNWIPVLSRDLEEAELHELGRWLWSMNTGRWNILTHYTPALRQLVYFERTRDAVAFKLVWGGR